MSPFRISVRAKPGSRRAGVGGRWADGDTLVVAVRARAADGRANAAIEEAVAAAFDVPRRTVGVARGHKNRSKIIEIDPAPEGAADRLRELLGNQHGADD